MKYFQDSLFKRIQTATKVTETGVSHGFCDSVFEGEVYEELIRTFPDPHSFYLVDKEDSGGGHKRFYIGPEYVVARNYNSLFHIRKLSKVWKGVIEEVSSPSFIQMLSESVGAKFNSICNFGFAYGDEGCIQEPHLDGAIREGATSRVKSNVAFLLYFNENVDPVSATELYDIDRKTVIVKGDTMRNSLFFFEQHPNSWHGFPLVPKNHTRRIVSLSYNYETEPVVPKWTIDSYIKVKAQSFANRVFKHI